MIMLFQLAVLVPFSVASSSTPSPTSKSTVDIFPLTTAISTLPFDMPHVNRPPKETTHSWAWPYPPRHYDKREDLTRPPTLTFDTPHTTRPPKETTHTWAWPYPPSSVNKREDPPQTQSSDTPHWTTRIIPSTSPSPPGPFRQCTDNHQNCGLNICYDPKSWWCCPGGRNVCKLGDVCAQTNSTTGAEGAVFGCGPGDVQDGLDPRISTITGPIATATSTPTPMGSAGKRVGVPGVIRGVVAVVRSVRAISLPAMLRPECCGDICCAQGEVCARSSEGAKCWPAASRRGIAGIEEARAEQDGMVHVAELQDKKGGGGGHGGGGHSGGSARPGAGGPAAGGGHRSGSSVRPVPSTLLYLVLILVPFAIASLPASSSSAPLAGTPQINPSPKDHLPMRWSPSKRWSCHKPKMVCGSNGCFEPNTHLCCKNPDGSFGLCDFEGGQVCCGNMCCGKDTMCNNIKGEYQCEPK